MSNFEADIHVKKKGKHKRKRTKVSLSDSHKLECSFRHESWPNRTRKQKLAMDIGRDEKFVSVWFQNRRAKIKREEEMARLVAYGMPLPDPNDSSSKKVKISLKDNKLVVDDEQHRKVSTGTFNSKMSKVNDTRSDPMASKYKSASTTTSKSSTPRLIRPTPILPVVPVQQMQSVQVPFDLGVGCPTFIPVESSSWSYPPTSDYSVGGACQLPHYSMENCHGQGINISLGYTAPTPTVNVTRARTLPLLTPSSHPETLTSNSTYEASFTCNKPDSSVSNPSSDHRQPRMKITTGKEVCLSHIQQNNINIIYTIRQ